MALCETLHFAKRCVRPALILESDRRGLFVELLLSQRCLTSGRRSLGSEERASRGAIQLCRECERKLL